MLNFKYKCFFLSFAIGTYLFSTKTHSSVTVLKVLFTDEVTSTLLRQLQFMTNQVEEQKGNCYIRFITISFNNISTTIFSFLLHRFYYSIKGFVFAELKSCSPIEKATPSINKDSIFERYLNS